MAQNKWLACWIMFWQSKMMQIWNWQILSFLLNFSCSEHAQASHQQTEHPPTQLGSISIIDPKIQLILLSSLCLSQPHKIRSNCILTHRSTSFSCFLVNKSILLITLMWGISNWIIADNAVKTPAKNLLQSTTNWESIRKTPQTRKFHWCNVSTSCRITGMWVYSSIWPNKEWMEKNSDIYI